MGSAVFKTVVGREERPGCVRFARASAIYIYQRKRCFRLRSSAVLRAARTCRMRTIRAPMGLRLYALDGRWMPIALPGEYLNALDRSGLLPSGTYSKTVRRLPRLGGSNPPSPPVSRANVAPLPDPGAGLRVCGKLCPRSAEKGSRTVPRARSSPPSVRPCPAYLRTAPQQPSPCRARRARNVSVSIAVDPLCLAARHVVAGGPNLMQPSPRSWPYLTAT